MSELGTLQDWNDIYDNEVLRIRYVAKLLQMKFGGKTLWKESGELNRPLYEEMRKWAEDELYKAGLVGTIVIDVETRLPTLDVRGRIEGAAEHKYGVDHERKRFEIIDAKSKGETYRGEKESVDRGSQRP